MNRHDPAAPVVAFESHSLTAGLYYRALCGRGISFHLLDEEELGTPPNDTDDTVRLPRTVGRFADSVDNWGWYKAALSFRAMRYHKVRGTFAETEAGRQTRAELIRQFLAAKSSATAALTAFDILENTRLDAVVDRVLPGLNRQMAQVRADAAAELLRDGVGDHPRNQLVTVLTVASLVQDCATVIVDATAARTYARVRPLLDAMHAEPGLEVAITAAALLYEVLSAMPMMAGEEAVRLDVSPLTSTPVDAPILAQLRSTDDGQPVDSGPAVRLEGAERYTLVRPHVSYRGSVGTRHYQHRDTGRLDYVGMFGWREGHDPHHHDHHEHHGGPSEEDLDPDALPEPIPHEHGAVLRWDTPYLPPIGAAGVNTFRYAEWDAIAGLYRPGRCRVVEEKAERGGATDYGQKVLSVHSKTLRHLQRQWSTLPITGLMTRQLVRDGEDIDLSRAMDMRVDLKAGVEAPDLVYIRNVPAARDMACGILIDVSMSTADHIESGQPIDDEAAMLYGRPYRTVLDHEREAALLLAEVIARTGDAALIHSFSSSGPELVRVQELQGARGLDRAVSRKLSMLRPVDATRMGAAIRHSAARLRRLEAKAKMLVVISDGLPYDEDYGDEYGDRKDAYAIADTNRAIQEAKDLGIQTTVFLVGNLDEKEASTIDAAELIPDPANLPGAVAAAYLTTRTSLSLSRRSVIDQVRGTPRD